MATLHEEMMSNIKDCKVLIAGGIGRPMYEALAYSGIKVLLTDTVYTDQALEAYIRGTLHDHLERIHSK